METLERSSRLELSQSHVDAQFAEIIRGVGVVAVTPEAQAPRRIEGYLARKIHLNKANIEGLSFTERAARVNMIADSALPVDNIKILAHRPIAEGDDPKSDWNTLATWNQSNGEFATYDAHNKLPEAGRLATTIHELTHGMSPLREENLFMYGSEEKRDEAAAFSIAVGIQSLETDTYINGYHKLLAEQLASGEIEDFRYFEEVSAILIEFSLTDRKKLLQIEAVQHAKIDAIAAQTGENIEKVSLISQPGSDEPVGADRTLLTLLDGVTTVQGIEDHVVYLKTKYASSKDGTKAVTRAHSCASHA